MYKVDNIEDSENGFKIKIAEKFHNLPKYQNIYKTGKNNNSNNNTYNNKNKCYIKVTRPHLMMKRAKTKLFALQQLLHIPYMSDNTNKNNNNKEAKNNSDIDASHKQAASMHYIIDNLMVLQHSIMGQAEFINRCSRLQLLFIFFQSALSIVFNSYNLVMYFLRFTLNERISLPPTLALLFYAHLILSSAVDILLTIVGFSLVYTSIERTIKIVNALMLYVNNELLANKLNRFSTRISTVLKRYSIFGLLNLDGSFISALLSGTVTYIIILVQYSDMPKFNNPGNGTAADE